MDESSDEQNQPPLPGFDPGGPYLQMAAICEKVLREGDSVLSLIRIVDRIMVSVAGQSAPAEMPPTPVNLTLVVGFKSGFARGAYNVRIRTVSPSQQVLSTFETPVLFEGDDRGVQLTLLLGFVAQEEGLYWFEVYLHEALFTKVPLRVMYQRMSVSQQ